MPPGDVEKPSSELEVQEHALALNTMPDAEMASVDQTVNASTEPKPHTQADQVPAIGEATPITQDQIDSITESVWQWIGQRLDAKCSQDPTNHEDSIEELLELPTKYHD